MMEFRLAGVIGWIGGCLVQVVYHSYVLTCTLLAYFTLLVLIISSSLLYDLEASICGLLQIPNPWGKSIGTRGDV